MSKEIQKVVKGFTVFDVKTKEIIYEGENILKTIQALYCGRNTSITFAHKINKILLDHAIWLQERNN